MDRHFEKSRGKQRFFDHHAAGWDKDNDDQTEHIRALVKEMGLRPGDTVIEPGCGTGIVSSMLLEDLGERGCLLGVDISRQMLEEAKAKSFGTRASFQHADAAHLPFAHGFADAVVCFRVFPHLDDIPGSLAEFNRVLKKDGFLVIAHPAGREKLNQFHTQAGGEVAKDMIPEEPQVRRLLREAGFEITSFVDRDDRYFIRAAKRV
ncbi:MAG TPA: methyltransferase domain-containing protein [archaeon]|nr:methyltransferase domain-containing protein [archaeon]